MKIINGLLALLVGLTMIGSVGADERPPSRRHDDCQRDIQPVISFVDFKSWAGPAAATGEITVKGKLMVPVEWNHRKRCFFPKDGAAAVVILHGSAGVDARGDFYARALNTAGIATLEIDMWEARGVPSVNPRPPLPLFTYRDAFAALKFLSEHPGIDSQRIGVMGFSWGGVITMASATVGVEQGFSLGGARFKAHLAHYPICYAYNNPNIPGSAFGTHKGNPLTGAPILIQIGELDGYDDGSAPCLALQASLIDPEKQLLTLVTHEGATHAWDRLQIPITESDPFAHRGAGGPVEITPNVEKAYLSRDLAVKFFRRNL